MGSINDCKNLLECALYWEKNDPDQLYFTQPMGGGDANIKTWTWKEAVGEARRMATYLKSLNFPEKSNIAICSKNCAHWIIADLAIWMAGHVSVPIFPILTADIVQYTLEHSESRLLFVGKLDPIWDEMKKGVADDLPKIAFPLAPKNNHKQWDDIIAKNKPMEKTADRSPEELATIIYTSGSTGKPKGVMLSFGAMYISAKGIATYLDVRKNDRVLSYLPLSHSFERFVVQAVSLYIGGSLWFAESLDTFLQDLQRARPTLFISVPRLWLKFQMGVFKKMPPAKLDRLLKIPILSSIVKKKIRKGLGLNEVRFAGSGSAPIPKEVLEWYRKLGLELLEGYGMTENFAYSHCTKPGQVRPGYVGAPYPDVQQRISPEGEILVKSPGTMMGYYKNPEATKESFTEDGFLRTGDLGEIDEMGRLKITGRAKELFKTSKGKYVAPAPIENMIANHPRVEACVVTGSGYPQPHGVVMLSEDAQEALKKGGKETIEKELAAHLKEVNSKLPAFEQLAFLAVTNDTWMPENGFLTPTMKIKRSKLESTYGPAADKWYSSRKPVVWES
ncbi:MAG: AMP-binding acetyl-CoA synthetase [Desulfobacteraceae bacterium]|nr:MAG: AMP-binding acetyl-CoA synthetase [Desulfobacteraceae bacterium]